MVVNILAFIAIVLFILVPTTFVLIIYEKQLVKTINNFKRNLTSEFLSIVEEIK